LKFKADGKGISETAKHVRLNQNYIHKTISYEQEMIKYTVQNKNFYVGTI